MLTRSCAFRFATFGRKRTQIGLHRILDPATSGADLKYHLDSPMHTWLITIMKPVLMPAQSRPCLRTIGAEPNAEQKWPRSM